MKKLTSAIFILIFFAAVIFSCTKKDEFQECLDNPECEYFRCKVDGKLWRPDCESSFLGCDAVDVQYYRDLNGGGLSIYSENVNNDSGIILKSQNVQKVNTIYSLVRGTNTKSYFYIDVNSTTNKFYVDTSLLQHILFTKIDTINFILEGTFQFTGINNDGESIEITDGKFRQHYRF